jgi:3-methyladenine DNA glycosylase AlkC
MAEKLKDMFFSDKFLTELGNEIRVFYPGFDQKAFNHLIYSGDWEGRELKQKMRHTTYCLAATLPKDYPAALKILTKVAPKFRSFDAMVFPDFVECYGLEDWDISLPALALFTRYSSSEFAIRPFLAKDPAKGMSYLQQWAKDKNHHLRRLASEGCRPKLPWAMALSGFRKDPQAILPILETLRDDPSEYVRRSVANNLNDISKDHPGLVLNLCEQWYGQGENTDWIVKRACRSLLRAGNKRALLLFGFGDPGHILVENLALDKHTLIVGDDLYFRFEMRLDTGEASRVRLEYGISFVKAKGKLSRKIFQIREDSFEAGRHTVSRKHSFKDLSTRKHYAGQHQITIIVNGVEKVSGNFKLIE